MEARCKIKLELTIGREVGKLDEALEMHELPQKIIELIADKFVDEKTIVIFDEEHKVTLG